MKAPRYRMDMWIKVARTTKKKYVLSIADMFIHNYEPIFCTDEQEVHQKSVKYQDNDTQVISEIVRINKDNTVTEGLSLIDIE